MMQSWFEHLSGAIVEDGAVRHFGTMAEEKTALKDGTVLVALPSLAVLAIGGDDATAFLQGQFTNDVRNASASGAQLSGHCTPKGRLLATFLLWREVDGSYRVELPASLMDGFRKRLAMYVLRAKVQIADASAETARLGLAGRNAATLAERLFGALPAADFGIVRSAAGMLLRLAPQRFEIFVPPEKALETWSRLAEDATPAGNWAWEWLDIQAGIPVIQPQTREEFVPQMVNFEALGGVSFKKGCYTGQEVVARAQHIGEVKRRMYRAHGESDAVPAPGTTVWHPGVEDGGGAGRVVSAAPSPDGGFDALVVLPKSAAEKDELRLESAQGLPLRLLRAG